MRHLGTTPNGLTQKEAELRLAKYGPNALARAQGFSALGLFINQFKNGLVLLLLVAGVASFFMGEQLDALLILAIVLLNALLGFFQEYRAEKSLEKLRQLSSPTASVLRDGTEQKLDASLLVPGDIIVLREGDKVPADARIIESRSLQTLEAALTGESLPVLKQSGVLGLWSRVQSHDWVCSDEQTVGTGSETRDPRLETIIPLGDRLNMAFSGTLVASGYAKCVVVATGERSELGKISLLLREVKHDKTAFQVELDSFSGKMGLMTIGVCVAVLAITYLGSGDLAFSLLVGISLAVAAVPEGLPAVITLSLALSVQRMVKKNVLVRSLPAAETLGSISIICTDKTGTLTKNEMTVKEAFVMDGTKTGKYFEFSGTGYSLEGAISPKSEKPDGALAQLLEIGATCNNASLAGKAGDPTELALLVSAAKAKVPPLPGKDKLREFTFTSDRMMMSVLVSKAGRYYLYAKGAPEVLASKLALSQGAKANLPEISKSLASKSYRVLAFAFRELDESQVNLGEKELESGLIFAGLQAMNDPPKEGVREAIAVCHRAGVDVKMITGDHLETAVSIANSLGIKGSAVSGSELAGMDDKELAEKIASVGVFARTAPEQKLKIVNVLKSLGHRVALTGDGVNDAPALKRADIGVAMGIAGTDVAKEASATVILDDNFATIVKGIDEGRRIFSNVRKFVAYLLGFNIAEVLIVLVSTLAFKFVPLIPGQLLWVNLVTDGLPAVALALDSSEKGVMERKPHPMKILDSVLIKQMLFIGVLSAIAVLYIIWGLRASLDNEDHVRTMVFTFLVFAEVIGVHVIRSYYNHPLFTNKLLWASIFATLALQFAILYTPLGAIFHAVPLALADWLKLGEAIAILIALSLLARKLRFV